MSRQPKLVSKLAWTAVFLLLFGLISFRQYMKFPDGRGLARWLVPADASIAIQLSVFVVLPSVAALVAGWAVARDSDD